MIVSRRKIALCLVSLVALALVLPVAGYAALKWQLQRSIYERHAPGTYFFKTFTGPWQPFRPLDEVSFAEAKSRSTYCVGVYDPERRLIVLERYLDGAIFFRYEYEYQANGWLRSLRGHQVGGPWRYWRADESG